MSNAKGVALMIGSMAAFAIGDTMIKFASQSISPAQGILLLAVFGAAMFAFLAIASRTALWTPDFWSRPIMLRNVVEALTSICFFSALAAAPLSLVVSIMQAVPLMVTIGAAVLLSEHVGPRRWIAIGIGLIGVLVMLRPWSEGIQPGALWAVGAAIGLATRDVAARFVPAKVATLQLALWGTLSLVPAALILMPLSGPHPTISFDITFLMLIAAAATAAGYYAVTAAMRIGEVSLVAPFRYTRLLFALALAVMFLGERPDALTLFGAIIVIGSGLFVLLRERSLANKTL